MQQKSPADQFYIRKYMQNGKLLNSLGVFEHWDNDGPRKYSRNIDPKNGKGIELIYKKL
jgi:hypothetical protein